MREIELITILSFYYFEYKKSNNLSADAFTKNFNNYFHTDYSVSTIVFEISNFKKVDPANNDSSIINEMYRSIWRRYINEEKIDELKNIYRTVKKSKYEDKLQIDLDKDLFDSSIKITNDDFEDKPEPRPDKYLSLGIKAYPRSKEVVNNSLHAANYLCENSNCNIKLFRRKNSIINYTEAHHLIPLAYQNYFDNSLDVEANVVSLCPYCHRKLHHCDEINDVLESLFKERKDRLKEAGINLSLEELLLMYR